MRKETSFIPDRRIRRLSAILMISGLLLFAGFALTPGRFADVFAATGKAAIQDPDPTRLPPDVTGRDAASGSDWPGRWLASAPDKTGFDPESLDRSVRLIGEMDGVYSVLVVRRGRLVVERYFREGYREKPHNMKSASKSLISALVGIAVDEGLLGLDQPIQELLPYPTIFEDTQKKRITVRHLLTMTSGLVPTSYQAYNSMIAESDWVEAALRRPMNAAPGTRFQYSTGDTHILSGILTAAAGMSTRAYAEKRLFGPLGIVVQGWDRDPSGVFMGGNNLSLFPRDMAKLGLLYLNGGAFGLRQVLPREWVRESTLPREDGDNEIYGRYGYLWYTRPGGEDAFVAVGFGGQYIYVSPPDDCVIVITATLESKGRAWEKTLFGLLQGGILGSLDGHPKRASTSVAASTPEGPVAAPGNDAPQPISRGRTTANLALRQDPGANGIRLALIPRNVEVPIFETTDGWHRTRYRGKPGWIYGGYVKMLALEPVEGGSPLQAPRAARTASRLNLRGGPGETHPVLMTLVPDSPLVVTAKTGKWMHVRAGDRKGWVYGPYVRFSPPSGGHVVRHPSAPGDLTLQKQTAAVPEAAPPAPIEDASSSEKRIEMLSRSLLKEKDRGRTVAARAERMRLSLENQRSDAVKTRAKNSGLTSDLIAAGEKIRTLEEELRVARSGRSAAETDLHRLRRETSSTARTADASKKALEALSEKLSDAQAREQILAGTLETLRKDGKTLRASVARLSGNLKAEKRRGTLEVSKMLEAHKKDRAAADSQIAVLEGALRKATSDRKRLQAELVGLRGDLAAERARTRKEKEEQTVLSENLADAQRRLRTAATALAAARKADETAVADLTALRDALAEKEKKIGSTAIARESLEKDLAALRGELAKRTEKAAAARSALSARLAETEKRLERERLSAEQARETAGTLSGQLSGAREKIGKLSLALNTVRGEKETLKNALVSAHKDLTESDHRAIEASTARKALEKDLVSSSARLASREKALAETLNRRDILAEAVGELRGEIACLRQEAEIAAERQTALSDTFDAAVEALRSTKKALQTARTDEAALNRDLSATRKDLAALRKRLDQSVTVQKTLETELNALRRENKAREKASQKDRSQLRSDLAFLERERESGRQAAERSDREEKFLSRELAAAKAKTEALVKSLETSRSDQERLEMVVTQLGKDLATERDAALESCSARNRLEKDLTSAAARLTVLEKALAERSDARNRLEAVAAGQKKALEARRREVTESGAARQKLLNDLKTATGRIERLDRALEAAGKDHEKLESSISALRRELSTRSRAAAASDTGRKNLEQRLAQSRETRTKLGNRLMDAAARQQEMVARMTDLQAELKRQRTANHRLAETARDLTAELTGARNEIDSLTRKRNDSQPKGSDGQRIPRDGGPAGTSERAGRSAPPADPRRQLIRSPPGGGSFGSSVSAESAFLSTGSESIDAFVRSWALAWSKKDANAYLLHYSTSFRPRSGLTLEAWRNRRRERIAKPAFIEVSVLNLSAEMMPPDSARVSFLQSYRSDRYRDRVLKILDLAREDGRWKITGEISRHITP